MDKLKPVPIPLEQRWQDFRVKYVPMLTFLLLVAAICWMWTRYVEPAAIVGEVEAIHANIISTVPGTLQELKVDRLQSVTNGQELAVVSVLDSDQLNAELAAAEADLLVMKARMDLDKTRNVDSYAHLHADLLQEQLSLDIARIHLRQTEGEFERAQKLLDSQLVARGVSSSIRNDFGYDVVVRDRDTLKAEVAVREKSIAKLEEGIKKMDAAGAGQLGSSDAAVEKAIQAERERIQLLQKPIVLRSPMNGFVSDVNHHAGERIAAGINILVVSANSSDRILAWMRQPITAHPKIGDIVQVRRITMGEAAFEAKIVQVGKQLETINPSLLLPNRNPERAEIGLPMLVQSPGVLKLVPGEPVQLRLVQSGSNRRAN